MKKMRKEEGKGPNLAFFIVAHAKTPQPSDHCLHTIDRHDCIKKSMAKMKQIFKILN